jgi:hypothetical protein
MKTHVTLGTAIASSCNADRHRFEIRTQRRVVAMHAHFIRQIGFGKRNGGSGFW